MNITEQQENEIEERIREAYNKQFPNDIHNIPQWVFYAIEEEKSQQAKYRFGWLSGHAAAMQKREQEAKAIAWCLGKSGEEIVVQMAALQENAKAYYRVKEELAVAKSFHDVAVQQRNTAWSEIERLKEELAAAKEREEKAVAVIEAFKAWEASGCPYYGPVTGSMHPREESKQKALAAFEASRKEKA